MAVVHMVEEVQSTPSISKLVNIERYSKYDTVIRVTARVLSVFERTTKVSLQIALVDQGQKLIQKAESLWLHECQAEIKEQVRKGRFASLSPGIRDDGVVIVGSRVKKWVEISYDNQELPLLSGDHPLSKLYAEKIHNESHSSISGISGIMAKVRLRFWVTKLLKILSSIRARCVDCKRRKKQLENQIM